MSRRARLRHEHALADVVQREERDRVAVRLVEQDDVLAFDHPLALEQYAHPPAERLGEQQPLRQRISDQELPPPTWSPTVPAAIPSPSPSPFLPTRIATMPAVAAIHCCAETGIPRTESGIVRKARDAAKVWWTLTWAPGSGS